MKAEVYSVQADLLLGRAADLQLGTNNETLLQQAQSTREAVAQLQDHLNEQYDESLSIRRALKAIKMYFFTLKIVLF